MIAGKSLRFIKTAYQPFTQSRNTWVLRRVNTPEVTPEGAPQRNPNELPQFQKLEVVDFESKKAAVPLKVILLEDIEGIGHQFDVVDVDRRLARTDLLLSKKVVYASPFDLKYYSEMKEKMAEELSARVRIPFDLLRVGRELQKLVVPIKVSMENAWTVNKAIVKASLRQIGVDMTDDCIFLEHHDISGPNFELEAKLVRFYVVVSKQYIVPMIGRISHISVDESKQILSPLSGSQPTQKDFNKYGIHAEEAVFSKSQEYDENFPVVEFMVKRRNIRV